MYSVLSYYVWGEYVIFVSHWESSVETKGVSVTLFRMLPLSLEDRHVKASGLPTCEVTLPAVLLITV